MIDRASAILFASTVVLALAAGSLLAVAGRDDSARQRDLRGADFQRLVGGLGFGADLDLSQCSACFDPRLSRTCDYIGPLPEGAAYCQRHSARMFDFDAKANANAARSDVHDDVHDDVHNAKTL
jgi:hypothetical protein